MSKQTVAEWLYYEIINFYGSVSIYKTKQEIIKQAKEMEKQQMIKFANDFLFHDNTDLTAEQYYNETFKY
jgi:hypothetical protein